MFHVSYDELSMCSHPKAISKHGWIQSHRGLNMSVPSRCSSLRCRGPTSSSYEVATSIPTTSAPSWDRPRHRWLLSRRRIHTQTAAEAPPSPALWLPDTHFFVFPRANCSLQELFDLFWQRGKSSFVSLSYLGAREASIGIWSLRLERAEVEPGDKHLIGICMGEESCDTTTFLHVPTARWGSTIDPCGGRVGRIWAELQTGRRGVDGRDTWQAIIDNYWAAFKGPHTGRKKKIPNVSAQLFLLSL